MCDVIDLRADFLRNIWACDNGRRTDRNWKGKYPKTAAAVFAGRLRQILPDNVLGPDYYHIPRINSLYIKHLYIKLPQEVSLKGVKEYLSKLSSAFSSSREYRTVRITIDVDPA